MFRTQFIETDRLRIAYHRVGEGHGKRLLFLHGNLSSSLYLAPLFPHLEDSFDVVAPDLRCFGKTEHLGVDATRGYRDWSDDIYSLVKALSWDKKPFALAGWSMGGDIAMQFAIDHAALLSHLILLAPGPPFGFGGSFDEQGSPHTPVGLGSGAGSAHPALVMALEAKSRFMLRDLLTKYYFNPPFRMSREWENAFIDDLGNISLGDTCYPGNYITTDEWPYVRAGTTGVLNAMAPPYADLSALLDIQDKPEILWIRGDEDKIVSNESIIEFGYLGKIGLVPGWPGEDSYPPQPMIDQLSYFFDRYEENGGEVCRAIIPGGHMCALESPELFSSAVKAFMGM